jgi:3',5'-cyclic AMP phosphodiesterase CpdA
MSSVPFFPCPGNHDYLFLNGAAYLDIHAVPTDSVPAADHGRYYSYDWGNVHFVSLEVMQSLDQAVSGNGPMLRWLDNDLRSTRQFWKIVYFHQPPWSTGLNEADPVALKGRAFVCPILENNGVQIVIGGHNHSYQRSQAMRNMNFVSPNVGTNYITSGGGGAMLYAVDPNQPMMAFGRSAFHYLRTEVSGTQIIIHAIRYDGVEIDTYTVAPTPAFSDDPKVTPVTLSPGPVAGATIRIIGMALAAEETFRCTPTPPTTMAGTTVTVNGQPIQLLYASPTQIYALLPFAVSGNITIRVTTANGFVERGI